MPKKSSLREETLNLIKGFTLENLEKYKEVNPKSVLGKIIGSNPNLKTKIPELIKEIESTIKEFSKLSEKDFKKAHSKYTAHLTEVPKKEKRKGLPELKKVKKPYCFRFAPSPSGPLHLGHIHPLLLNSEYAKKYKGKFIIRIEDTNPAKISEEAYKQIEEDANWITQNNVSEVIIQSKFMEDYYQHAKNLIKSGKAYVSSSTPEEWKKFISEKTESPERNNSPEKQLKKWEDMFSNLKDVVLRIKTNMKHKNPAIRDWPAFRITDEKHLLQGKKYRVWPLMNFSVAVDDHRSSLTHVIRGKDHLTNAERQKYIYDYFGWEVPDFIHIGRINFEGVELSATQFNEDIKKGKFSGSDDPKLPTITAFKRRGLKPEAFTRYVHELGPSKVDKTVNFEDFMKAIYSFNRELIEPEANRFFIIENPIEIEIKNLPNIKAELPVHPNFPERGKRKFHKSHKFYIEKTDKPKKDKNYRLMHLCNFSGKDHKFISKDTDPKLKTKALHWLPISKEEKLVKVKVKMAHVKDIDAVGETGISKLKEGDIVQFERKFFARFDSIEKGQYIFYETHK